MKKKFPFFLKVFVSFGFVGWIIWITDWRGVFEYISKITWWQIILYFATVVAGMVVSAYKWKILAEQKGLCSSLVDFFKFYFAGSFINNFMPSFIGGDTFRAYEIGKKDGKYAEAASSVMMDRMTGFVGASVLAFFFALLNIKGVMESKLLSFFYFLLVFSFGVDVFLARLRHSKYLRKKIGKYLPEKIKVFLREVGNYSNQSGVLTKSTALGALFALVGVAIPNYILFWSLGIRIEILDYLSTIFIISIISAIPISINNIGLKEWAYVTFFAIHGTGAESVVAVAILSRFLQMILSFLALPVYLKSKR